jgi:hypothetical protein
LTGALGDMIADGLLISLLGEKSYWFAIKMAIGQGKGFPNLANHCYNPST